MSQEDQELEMEGDGWFIASWQSNGAITLEILPDAEPGSFARLDRIQAHRLGTFLVSRAAKMEAP